MAVHYIDRAQARRIAVLAQLLDHPRPPALRSPFDRLVHDRVRLAEVFEYEYKLEMYKPKGVHSEIDALASWLGLTVTGSAARGRRR
jgi:uncharacterized protein YcaQ